MKKACKTVGRGSAPEPLPFPAPLHSPSHRVPAHVHLFMQPGHTSHTEGSWAHLSHATPDMVTHPPTE